MSNYAIQIATGYLLTYPSTAYNFGVGDFSLSAMVLSQSGGPVISRIASSGAGYALIVNSDSSLTFAITDGTNYATFQSIQTAVFDGCCHGVAAIRSNGKISVYLDGELLSGSLQTNTSSPINIDNTLALQLGATLWQQASIRQFSGHMMNVGLWSEALDASQLSAAMFGCLVTISSQMQGFWTLNNTTNDSSPNNNPAQIVGPLFFVPCLHCVWTEGENSYSFCQVNNQAGSSATTLTMRQTVPVASGAPALYSSINDNSNHAQYPAGVTLTIMDPSGTTYNQNANTDSLYVETVDGSPWLFTATNPQAGDWLIVITAPVDVAFVFQMQTVPSEAVPTTMLTTLAPYFASSAADLQFVPGFWSALVGAAVVRFTAFAVGVGAVMLGATLPVAFIAAAVAFIAVVAVEVVVLAVDNLDKDLSNAEPQVAGLGGFVVAPQSVLLIDANIPEDEATVLCYKRRAKKLYPFVNDSGYKTKQASLISAQDTRTNVAADLVTDKLGYVSACGHGMAPYLMGWYVQGNKGSMQEVLKVGRYAPAEAAGKIFHILACYCGYTSPSLAGLGQDLVVNGALAFFGYKDKFAMPTAKFYEFVDCDIEVDKALIQGNTAQQAHDRTIALFQSTISRLRVDGYEAAAAALQGDMEIFVSPVTSNIYGNTNAQLQYKMS